MLRSSSTKASRVSVAKSTLSGLLFVTIVVLFASNATAQTAAWRKQQTGTLAWLHAVYFLDSARGWAVGSRGTVLVTTNGGKTWLHATAPTVDIIRDIYFLDESNGWMVCERNVYELKTKEEPRTYLMNTRDGGQNWDRVDMGRANVDARVVRAVFRSGGRAWAFGEGGAIYLTRDAGVNWTKLVVPTRHLLLGGTFVDDDRGWIVGAGATIIQTSDGGDTWHLSRLAGAEGTRFTATSFVDNRLGWAVGSGGVVLRTINGGRTWTRQKSGVSTDLLDVKFLDALEGWAVGTEGTVIYTNDGGVIWNQQRSNTAHPLERIFFTDRTHGWAVGFGGTVITYVSAEAPQLRR